MAVDFSAEIFRLFSEKWQYSMDRKDFHEAIIAGIAAYLAVREKNEQTARGALNLIHVAISALSLADAPVTAQASCSFCGQSGPRVRLGAGSAADAYICADCVATLNETLNPVVHS